MLAIFIILSYFVKINTQHPCEFGCVCFPTILECSGLPLAQFPDFGVLTKLSTKEILVRNIEYLDMGTMIISEWKNLETIDLRG